MVAYETTADKKELQKKQGKDGKKLKYAALAVGGAFVVGAAIYSFGSVAGTLGNGAVFGAM